MARTIRVLEADEVERLVDWAAEEGWNPGLADAAAFRAADPEGCLGAFVDGEMVAGISAVAYGAGFGFIGLYIVAPAHRGRGHGRAVWDAGMARLGGRTVGLDGVPAQQDNYAQMGFAKAYGTVRFTGRPPVAGVDGIVAEADVEAVAAFDAECFPAPRRPFLERWFEAPRIVRVALTDGVITGYAVARACREGNKVGPLFARDVETALKLFAALGAAVAGPLAIDVPAYQADFIAALRAAGLVPGFETARMYRGPAPEMAGGQVFGTTSLELG
jgi:hypothetical protein